MTRPVPAATATLQVLSFLSAHATPVPAVRIGEAIDLPRSSTYHLLAAMAELGFVIHYPEDRSWGIGVAAWEVGLGFARQAPLARLGRVPLARLVDHVKQTAHLVVLHGADVLYVVEERVPGRPHLVTDVGVRLPSHLTASGRAILSTLPRAHVDALYPSKAQFVSRTGRGPSTPTELRRLLSATRQRGFAAEDGEVTPGFASVAAAITSSTIRASVAVTWDERERPNVDLIVQSVAETAAELSRRLATNVAG